MIFSTLTFNMQNGQPWDESHPDVDVVDLDRTADFLRCQDADIVFLQEVERGYDGGAQIDPPPNYSRLRCLLPGYDSVFAYPQPNKTEIPFGLGLAIFSKSRLRNFARLDLPAADIEFEFGGAIRHPSNRLLIAASTELQGREVRLINTHLQAFFMIGASSADHPAQRNMIEAELRRQTGPAILAGDLNSAPDEGVIEQFASAGFQCVQTEEVTWRRKPFVIDHIFFNAPFRLVSHQVIPTSSSDHHAVKAELAFA